MTGRTSKRTGVDVGVLGLDDSEVGCFNDLDVVKAHQKLKVLVKSIISDLVVDYWT
jgi:hypothetical protein